ncbi:uncharacterized protein VTP21DRAFT_7382 [Calcarisporiella thermophila]|uniref:uncharacterized protein n=1 Tax=Calcarisporiella thermophila TaxID=911321 RepID=UPI0037447677
MGKHKKGYGGLFEAYVSSLPPRSGQESPIQDVTPLPENMRASTLIEQIGSERSWTASQIASDLEILEKNRIYTVSDLRILSKESWGSIELLPLVKDLLRGAINRGRVPIDTKEEKARRKKEKKKEKKKERKMEKNAAEQANTNALRDGASAVSSIATTSVDIANPSMIPSVGLSADRQNGTLDVASSTSSSSSSSSSSESSAEDEKIPATQKNTLPLRPIRPIQAISSNRISVTTQSGTYEADRYCPHKKVDLAVRGVVVGNSLICTKHDWTFSLDRGGQCDNHRASIHACRVNDW